MKQLVYDKKAAVDLIAISFLSLFLELALIRLINSRVQVVAYFNNFLILSAFFGLGFGSLLTEKKYNLFQFFPTIFVIVILSTFALSKFGVKVDISEHVIWAQENLDAQNNIPAHFVIIFIFCLNFLFFVPLGFRLGQSLKKFDNRLIAYAFDLLGSILGVAIFGLMSYMQTSPLIWFSLSSLVTFFLLKEHIIKNFGYLLFILVGILFSSIPFSDQWSPYYKVSWQSYRSLPEESKDFLGYVIYVDTVRIQDALKFTEALENNSGLRNWIPYYRLPYHFREPNKVLILGGGSGNDATIALKYGAKKVDVVEIDPVIIRLGYSLHPHKPYLDPRVNAVNDDARSFLRKSDEQYDLIIMDALDSHHQLAGLSTLRLESFMYTVESFKDVRKHMNQNSIFLVNLATGRPWMDLRLYWSLTEAFGYEPKIFSSRNPYTSVAFVYGPATVLNQNLYPELDKIITLSPEPYRKVKSVTTLSTDNWPHLYLSDPKIPKIYIYVLATILALTVVALVSVGSAPGLLKYTNLFFLGAGFMLLETRSITAIALFFGSTWIVNAIIIGSILVIIFIGNALILYNSRIPIKICYLGLFITLVLGYLVPSQFILGFPFFERLILTTIWFGMPIFFASLIFSLSFRIVTNTASAFGTNLLGVVIGGIFEYSSMVFGLNFLYLIALFFYSCSLFFRQKLS
jgi:spermidine synthase